MTDFFKRTLAEWKALDPKHLINTGGFSYLNDSHSGIDWRTIMSDPNDDVCAVEINSTADRDVTVPMVTQYCQSLGKPWFLAAWSSCLATPNQFSGDLDHWATDADMAAHAGDMYDVQFNRPMTHPAPAYAAIGSDFWNLGSKTAAPTCDLSPAFPLTYFVIKKR